MKLNWPVWNKTRLSGLNSGRIFKIPRKRPVQFSVNAESQTHLCETQSIRSPLVRPGDTSKGRRGAACWWWTFNAANPGHVRRSSPISAPFRLPRKCTGVFPLQLLLVGDLCFDELGQKNERLLPAEIAGLERNDGRRSFLQDVQLSSA